MYAPKICATKYLFLYISMIFKPLQRTVAYRSAFFQVQRPMSVKAIVIAGLKCPPDVGAHTYGVIR